MDVGQVVFYAIAAAFNLALAALVLATRNRGAANGLTAALFLVNALASILTAPVQGILPFPLSFLHVLAQFSTFGILLVLPFAVPYRRLPARVMRVLVPGLMAACALPFAVTSVVTYYRGSPQWCGMDLLFSLLYYGTPVLGTIVLLDAYLSSAPGRARNQARFFLGAYAMKLAQFVGGFAAAVQLSYRPAMFCLEESALFGAAQAARIAFSLAAGATFLALLLALAVAWTPWRRAERTRTPWEDASVIGIAALGFVVFAPGVPSELEYLVLRPLVLGYALLSTQLLDADVRRNRAAVAVAVVAASGAIYFVAVRALSALGAAPEVVAAGSFMAALAGGLALGGPVVRAVGKGDDASETRRLAVYRMALDAAEAEGQDGRAFDSLRALREELGITDREHAIVAGAPPAPRAVEAGPARVGRYRVERRLGKGGYGEVWLARDERLGREVALKRLAGSHRRDAIALKRFDEEVRLASAVAHPNIVSVYDLEVVGADSYLVMEYVPGGSLEDRLAARGPLDEREARALASDLLDALDALHARSIVHRDVKPSNVLFDEAGRAKLADFTIAREVVSGDTVGATRGGAPVGTLAYMAPEQARGISPTPSSDLYAAAATVYAALAGRPPIALDGVNEFEARIELSRAPPALPLPRVSEALNAWLATGLAKTPRARFESAAAMRAALVD